MWIFLLACPHPRVATSACPASLDAACPAPAIVMGSDATLEQYQAAFPDLHAEAELTLHAPPYDLVRFVATGTQKAPWDGHPPADRHISARGVEVWDGHERRIYLDEQTLRVQLGHVTDDVRPAIAAPDPPRRDDTPADPAVLVASIAAWNERRWDDFSASFTDDLVVRDLVHAADFAAPRGAAFLRRIGEVNFPDGRWTQRSAFAAGDWAVAEILFTGTAGAALGPIAGRKLAFDLVELCRMENGRIAEVWIVGNGLHFKRQLGVADPP